MNIKQLMPSIEAKNEQQLRVDAKASELCTLCGVEIAIIVFLPAKKPFSFSHPNIQSILDRFLSRNSNCLNPSSNHLVVESCRNANAHELNVELSQLMNQLESKRKRGDVLEKMRKVGRKQCWWEKPIEELGLQEMEQLKASMEEQKKNVTREAYQLTNEINSITNSGCSEYFVMNNGVRQCV
ncbi:hypothetical protein FEM48_Zijuj09G0143300 [Ziziphus jujuba var. spinosa]|uniref:MADS-box domain-containing protein n=1 Tax=Ziziphus jujuba var. spinosa TaxID=714518 RepID=A0A978UTH0_ZIZJJ|nr:hypothetical protein FEM48_Zijuj09G0143300 [Ziziphus jujuba var. spinosa]